MHHVIAPEINTQKEAQMKTNAGVFKNPVLKGKIPGDATGIQVKKTVCGICSPLTHCGIDAYVKDGVVVKVEGSRENPQAVKGWQSRKSL